VPQRGSWNNFGICLQYSEYSNKLLKVVLRFQIILQRDECHNEEVGKTSVFVCNIQNIPINFRTFKLSI
jgi:hypothetical protein